ncbi:MAG: hypothetical protein SGILL_007669 [Bacillariaceae sp.]
MIQEFFKKIGVVSSDAVAPSGCTVRDIREIALGVAKAQRGGVATELGWIGELKWKIAQLIFENVLEDSSYEDILHCERIVCTAGSDKELKIQRLLVGDRLIECKTDAKTSGGAGDDTTDVSARGDSVSLVLGPSGSGKTTFCANEPINSASKGKVFRVYMYSNDLCGTEGRVERLRMILGQQIRKTLGVSEKASLGSLDMTLYAIIDEAGNDAYFANKDNLNDLRRVVEEFATDGQLVLSGTGLDLLTTDIGSTGEGIQKIRMLPWSIEEFAKLAKDDSMVRLVKKHFVYGAMVSNARAASLLLKWLIVTKKWGEPDENVPHVIRGVAYGYISGNGLKDLDDRRRRRVVRAVLKVLEACKYDDPSIPAFDQEPLSLSQDELSKAKSLIDVHVKKTGTETTFHDGHHYAVSVTPAIALVLATLLGSSASLVHRWSGFEAVTALHELFKVAREATSEDVPECKIVQLDKPYDARKNNKNLSVPVMDPFTVLVNGKLASFADVMAYCRLIQAKHCEDSNGTAQLYIKNELKKMGLLKCSPFEKKVFARSLYQIWKTYTESGSTARPAAQQEQAAEHGGAVLEGMRRTLYPASLLVSERRKQTPVCWEFKKHGTRENPLWSRTGSESDGTSIIQESDNWVDNWVDRDKPLTVVFVTNGQRFQVKQDDEDGKVEQGFLSSDGILRGSTGQFSQTAVPTKWTRDVLANELIEGVNVELVFARA